MPWITYEDVEPIIQTGLSDDPYIEGLIDHVQGLAESVIGDQGSGPLDPGPLASVFAEIVARRWRGGKAASSNPAGYQSESVEDYSYSVPTGSHLAGNAGLGLTKAERKDLKAAVGRTGLWVQPTTRGNVETAPRHHSEIDDWLTPESIGN